MLRPHKTSPEEIGNLWQLADRDINDAAKGGISEDWRFNIAYNAALQLCTLLLYAEGYEPAKGQLAHYRILQTLPIIQPHRKDDADYLDSCRQIRNKVEYDRAGFASKQDADELIDFASGLRDETRVWLKQRHPKLAPRLSGD
ncbi:MAG: hypothetical protein WC378_15290 [Opitutaceae bacterium]